jgi:hypothetical protein
MGGSIAHSAVWALIRAQHGVVSRAQLLDFGFSVKAIEHRIRSGRLRVIWPGVYAVGQLNLTREGRWMAAILAAGEGAALSHESAAALWDIYPSGRRLAGAGLTPIHVSVPANRTIRLEGIKPHRRKQMPPTTTKGPIPLSQPLFTLVDLAATLGDRQLESAINEADRLGLVKTRHAKLLADLPRTRAADAEARQRAPGRLLLAGAEARRRDRRRRLPPHADATTEGSPA